jgi:hypothetical protein
MNEFHAEITAVDHHDQSIYVRCTQSRSSLDILVIFGYGHAQTLYIRSILLDGVPLEDIVPPAVYDDVEDSIYKHWSPEALAYDRATSDSRISSIFLSRDPDVLAKEHRMDREEGGAS